jgi:hypothetical protein
MKKAILTTVLGLSLAAPVLADEVPQSIYMDLNPILNAGNPSNPDLITSVFSEFNLDSSFAPTSTYIDTTTWTIGDNPATTTINESLPQYGGGYVSAFTSDGMIGTGDSVTDAATGVRVSSLSPFNGANFGSMYDNDWGLSIDYSLAGTAIVAPDQSSGDLNYIGDFSTGSFSLNLTNYAGTFVQELFTADYTHTVSTSPQDSQVTVNFFSSIDMASLVADIFFFGNDEKFEDRLAGGSVITIKAGGNLSALNDAPQQVGTSTTYTRTTNPGSYDVSVVPEPTSLAIMGLGLLGFAASRRRS